MAKSIEFNGKTFAAQTFSAGLTKLEKNDTLAQDMANAATLQVALHGDTNWLVGLFNSPAYRLASGKLNKPGRELFAFVQAHCPLIQWDAENKKPKKRKVKANNALNGKLAKPFTDNGEGKPELVDATENPAFTLSLAEYREAVAAKAENKGDDGKPLKGAKAETIGKRIGEMVDQLNQNKVTGDAAELAALREKIGELSAALSKAEKMHKNGNDFDAEKAVEAQTGSHSGKASTNERRATKPRKIA